MEYFYLIFKLIVALVVVFGLMMIAIKFSNKGVNKINSKKYVKVIDRLQISKESFIVILKIGEKGLVLLTSANHTEKLEELTNEEIESIEKNKQEGYEEMTKVFEKIINKVKLKEKKNEQIK